MSVIDRSKTTGLEAQGAQTEHLRGVLSFWDAIPQLKGNRLTVEIMTPHQGHYYYYQDNPKEGSASPHESGQPTPISYLTVPPGSGFTFHVTCDLPRLQRLAPSLVSDGHWKDLLRAAFEHAFDWCGFGAKTAVGYGAMERDQTMEEERRHRLEQQRIAGEEAEREAERRRTEQEAERREQRDFEALSDNRKRLFRLDKWLEELRAMTEVQRRSRLGDFNRDLKSLTADAPGWADQVDREQAASLLEAAYDLLGWAERGVKSEKRRKQEQKKRASIERVRKGAPS